MKHKAKIFSRFEFTQQFLRFLLVDRIMIRKDNLVLVTGKRGEGKTSLSLKIILGFSNLNKIEEYYNLEVNKFVEKKKKYHLRGLQPFTIEKDLSLLMRLLLMLLEEVQ